jgi:hypothetical protein
MAQADLDAVGRWILENADKAGSPDYVQMSEVYRKLAAGGSAAAPTGASTQQGGADPNSFRNVVGRVASDAVMGIPDLAIAAANVITKPGDWLAEKITGEAPASRRIEPLAPQLRKEWNVAELPENAPYWQRIAEGAGAGLPYGLGGIVRAGSAGAAAGGVRGAVTAGGKELVRNTVAPTVTSDIGARAGGAIGGETGQLIGGVLGGVAPSARPAAANWVQSRYTGKGDPNAPAIAAAAERLGIEPTAGALGNYDIQKRENALAATPALGPNLAAREQARIREQITATGEDIGAQRGGVGGSVAATGDDIAAAAAQRVVEDHAYSSAGQENLQRTIGDATQVPITDIITTATTAMQSPNATVPMRNSLRFRLEQQLYPLINRRPDGTPILDANGNATVPYGALKGWRSDLGRSFEQGNQPRARELYDPATRAMAGAAADAGVPRGDFNAVQSFTRGVEGPGGLVERLAPYEKEPGAAYNYTLEGGLKNPERLETFATETAGDPRQERVFGNYLQHKLGDPVVGGTAQGANTIAKFVENADPRALATIAGPQLSRVQDLATLARGVDVPTGQRGLGTSVAGVGTPLVNKVLGSELLGQIGGAIDPILAPIGRGIGWVAGPALNAIQQRMMQSDAAKRGLLGQPMGHRMTLDDLVRTLNIIGQSQQPQQPPYR